jgi:small subunit ribosomal protein S15
MTALSSVGATTYWGAATGKALPGGTLPGAGGGVIAPDVAGAGVPQLGQDFASSGIAVPHLKQNMVSTSVFMFCGPQITCFKAG